jgi:N-acyl-D-amino-acid deacylase
MTLIIQNGLIVDGSGKPGFYGDVVIDGDKIVEVKGNGERNRTPVRTSALRTTFGRGISLRGFATHGEANTPSEASAEGTGNGRDASPTRPRTTDPQQTIIDATGCIVSPGFIDAHAHSDAYLVLEPDAPSKISQGITTEINGQCGGSVAPRYGEARLSGDWATLLGSRLTWRSLAEYRAVLEAAKPAINTIQFVGHNTLRSSVVGYAGRAATSDELKEMQRFLAESLDAGGWGLTTGLIYQPGKYSTPEEVVALAKVAAERGGFYATHMRSEGDRILEAIDEVIDLVRATGIRAEVSHLKTSGKRNWHKIDAVLEKIENAIGEGLLLGSDRYPFCAAGTDLDIVLPDWAQEGAAPAEMARFADPETRAKIVAEINASDRDWSTVMIGGTWSESTKPFSGQSVSEILGSQLATRDMVGASLTPLATADAARFARGIRDARGRVGDASLPSVSPGELICRILELDGCKTGAFFFGMSEDNLDKILSRPWIVPGSDASLRAPWGPLGADHPHPRAYGTMPEFYRRVRALGVSREDAIARMTSVPARRFGIAHRGVIEKGAFADIAIWKEDEFSSSATYVEPHKFSRGVKAVLVNGAVSYTEGKFTGDRAGRFLERK